MTHTIYTQPEVNLHAVKALAVRHSPEMARAAELYVDTELRRRALYRSESDETLACTVNMLATNPAVHGYTVDGAKEFCDSMLAELGRRNNRRRNEN